MASTRDFFEFIREQLSALPGVTYRAMMGEYIVYKNGVVVGGIYDDRLLLKPLPPAVAALPDAPREIPYPRGKPMLLVEDIDSSGALCDLFRKL